ncbi:hypothetical protein L873DRAFT_1105792 [Choiromyces venosus 120613-1]|uniref:Uncharacterized protein n=1 Tax=Choiromyces venosus 120613-1 TaxID=1336337 RepID=A0A3N4JHG9_9PEZI|nr:hypothetical protein L873DRAFT_1105792 [Choiromyces venosus 120613-1]
MLWPWHTRPSCCRCFCILYMCLISILQFFFFFFSFRCGDDAMQGKKKKKGFFFHKMRTKFFVIKDGWDGLRWDWVLGAIDLPQDRWFANTDVGKDISSIYREKYWVADLACRQARYWMPHGTKGITGGGGYRRNSPWEKRKEIVRVR